MLVLDTNVYLDADNDAGFGRRLAAYLAGRREQVGLSSVVAELLVGVATAEERRRFLAATLDAVPAARVLTPTQAD